MLIKKTISDIWMDTQRMRTSCVSDCWWKVQQGAEKYWGDQSVGF